MDTRPDPVGGIRSGAREAPRSDPWGDRKRGASRLFFEARFASGYRWEVPRRKTPWGGCAKVLGPLRGAPGRGPSARIREVPPAQVGRGHPEAQRLL
ncbi:hypothetical protein SSPO_063930 [Streptomyces antimycoticus]|uniref:Uncharacterized protein n=1 Tax=Streptomyces antimycoticus TaxID=68175 RepID=A0A499UNN5_9ACTN|nr:hypothetical protein SSPO_063930 [Streptomyces antimycoticus]